MFSRRRFLRGSTLTAVGALGFPHLGQSAIELTPGTPEEFGTLIKADIAKWSRVLRDAGIKPE